MTEQLGMDPFLVYLIGVVAVMLIGWLWLELRWKSDQLRQTKEEAERAINFAADLLDLAHEHGFDIAPQLDRPAPRTTGPAFRRNGVHLKRVQ